MLYPRKNSFYLMKSIVLFTILILLQLQLFSQSNLFETEKELKILFDSLYTMEDTPERKLLNEEILSVFKTALENPNAKIFKWTNLTKIGKVYSPDKKLMIFTWHLAFKGGKYEYYGIIRYSIEKSRKSNEEIFVLSLHDRSEEMKNPAVLKLSDENWYGALYFGMKEYKFRHSTIYALFGYDFNDNYSQKKLIEILEFDKNGNADFSGKFDMDFQELKRIIFEYSDNVAMTLRYDERLDLIIYDHLTPFEPIFTGSYRFYGPDGSYDGLKFNKSTFQLMKDVDARNE